MKTGRLVSRFFKFHRFVRFQPILPLEKYHIQIYLSYKFTSPFYSMISFYLKKPTSCFLFLQFWIVQFFDSLWTHCKCLNPIAIFYKIRIDYDSFLCSASDSLLYRKSQYGAPSAMVPVLTNFICIISART